MIVIDLPDDPEWRADLERKRAYYHARLDARLCYAPEALAPHYYAAVMMDRLLGDGRLDVEALGDELAERLGGLYEQQFYERARVLYRYTVNREALLRGRFEDVA